MKWAYEVEGYELPDGTWYLPDFWLPNCKTFFEVKGILVDKDMQKMHQLAKAVVGQGIMVMMGGFNGSNLLKDIKWHNAPGSLGFIYPFPGFEDPDYGWTTLGDISPDGTLIEYNDVMIVTCRKCDEPYFVHIHSEYTCRKCGLYDGTRTFGIIYDQLI